MRLTVLQVGVHFVVAEDTAAGPVPHGYPHLTREHAIQAMLDAQARHEERQAFYERAAFQEKIR